jgi:hypothetical protein
MPADFAGPVFNQWNLRGKKFAKAPEGFPYSQ